MKRHHLAALVLAAAYLLMPPPEVAGDHFRINFSAPLSKWVELRRFDSVLECEAAKQVYRQRPAGGLSAMLDSKQRAAAAMRAARCTPTNDYRLKGD